MDSYDKQQFSQQGSVDSVQASAEELSYDLQALKNELMNKGEATALFAQEKNTDSLSGIVSAMSFKACLGKMPTRLLRKKPLTYCAKDKMIGIFGLLLNPLGEA